MSDRFQFLARKWCDFAAFIIDTKLFENAIFIPAEVTNLPARLVRTVLRILSGIFAAPFAISFAVGAAETVCCGTVKSDFS